jgi:hypothetical protein
MLWYSAAASIGFGADSAIRVRLNRAKQEVAKMQNKENKKSKRAVAYYRHSIFGRKEDTVLRQQRCVRKWARKHGVEIIKEFVDSKSDVRGKKSDGDNSNPVR